MKKWLVTNERAEDNDDDWDWECGVTVEAVDDEGAVKKWAKRYDAQSWDYTISCGDEETVAVMPAEHASQALRDISEFTVSGKIGEPRLNYSARRERCVDSGNGVPEMRFQNAEKQPRLLPANVFSREYLQRPVDETCDDTDEWDWFAREYLQRPVSDAPRIVRKKKLEKLEKTIQSIRQSKGSRKMKWLVTDETCDGTDEWDWENAKTVEGVDDEDAAVRWAEEHDVANEDYPIVGGENKSVAVRSADDDPEHVREISQFTVSGEILAHYSAYRGF